MLAKWRKKGKGVLCCQPKEYHLQSLTLNKEKSYRRACKQNMGVKCT